MIVELRIAVEIDDETSEDLVDIEMSNLLNAMEDLAAKNILVTSIDNQEWDYI